jgi:hypothetical protein
MIFILKLLLTMCNYNKIMILFILNLELYIAIKILSVYNKILTI